MAVRKSHPVLSLVNSYMIDSPQPASISYLWNFGSLLGLCLVIQLASGIFLAMHYNSSTELAFASVEHIMRDLNEGWMIRYIHANGASFFFLMVYAHMARGLFYGSYQAPRTLAWAVGVVIFLLLIITAFLGYVLPWGSMSFWGSTVITNLASSVPWLGDSIVQFIWGSFSVGAPTLSRFFSLHYLMPFVLAALVVVHLLALHTHGSNNPLGITGNIERLSMHPYFVFKDLVTVLLFFLAFGYVVFFNPNLFAESDNYIEANPLVTPLSIVPEWYLLPFYAILRSIPNKLLGVVAMLLAILLLLLFPVLDKSLVRSSTFRPLNRFVLMTWFMDVLLLGFLGQCHVEEPYSTISFIAMVYYFAYPFVLLPLISSYENIIPFYVHSFHINKKS